MTAGSICPAVVPTIISVPSETLLGRQRKIPLLPKKPQDSASMVSGRQYPIGGRSWLLMSYGAKYGSMSRTTSVAARAVPHDPP